MTHPSENLTAQPPSWIKFPLAHSQGASAYPIRASIPQHCTSFLSLSSFSSIRQTLQVMPKSWSLSSLLGAPVSFLPHSSQQTTTQPTPWRHRGHRGPRPHSHPQPPCSLMPTPFCTPTKLRVPGTSPGRASCEIPSPLSTSGFLPICYQICPGCQIHRSTPSGPAPAHSSVGLILSSLSDMCSLSLDTGFLTRGCNITPQDISQSQMPSSTLPHSLPHYSITPSTPISPFLHILFMPQSPNPNSIMR